MAALRGDVGNAEDVARDAETAGASGGAALRPSARAARTVGRSGAVRARFFGGHGMIAHGPEVRRAMREGWEVMPLSPAGAGPWWACDRAFQMDNALRR